MEIGVIILTTSIHKQFAVLVDEDDDHDVVYDRRFFTGY